MSFPKELDSLIRGGGELSFIFSCVLAEKKEKVLLVDDRPFAEHDQTGRFSYFEKRLLQEIGKKFNIDTLTNIERFTTTLSTACLFDHRILSLNSGPLQNVLELKRKFPCADTPDFSPAFENTFFEASESLVQCWIKQFEMKNAFQLFLKENKLSWCQNLGRRLLHYMPALDFYIQSPFDSKKETELYEIHTALSLIGPSYSYHRDEFCSQLRQELQDKGGFFKKTNIREKKSSRKNYVVELESYEGLVYPSHFIDEASLVHPSHEVSKQTFSCWEVALKMDYPCLWDHLILPHQSWQGGSVLFSGLFYSQGQWVWKAYFEQPELAIDSHVFVFLEKALQDSLKVLPFSGHYEKLGDFKRRHDDLVVYRKNEAHAWKYKSGLFSSLLRLYDVIMKS